MKISQFFGLLLLFFYVIYTGWFAFFTDKAIAAQERLPWGVRLPSLLGRGYTRFASMLAFIFLAFGLFLVIRSILTGTAFQHPGR
jgi:hypothetical protein